MNAETVVEYGILIAFIGLVVLFGIYALGINLEVWYRQLVHVVTR